VNIEALLERVLIQGWQMPADGSGRLSSSEVNLEPAPRKGLCVSEQIQQKCLLIRCFGSAEAKRTSNSVWDTMG